ncbi:MAG: alkaline phosphatase family protein [bacterium]
MPVRPQQIKLRRRDPSFGGHPKSKSPIKFFLVVLLALAGYWGYYEITNLPEPPIKKKLIVLGFEGADPHFIQKYWADLPNVRRLAENGYMGELRTVFPPETPVSWASFAVGANPGVHGLFSRFHRPQGTYSISPDSFMRVQEPKYLLGRIPIRSPKVLSTLDGTPFWELAAEHDNSIRTVLLRVPVTFPPTKNACITTLSGLGVPDISGKEGVYHHFSTRYEGEIQETSRGGKLIPLTREGQRYQGVVIGPPNPVLQGKINRLKEKLSAVRLKKLESQLALWLLDRTSESLLIDRERYLQTLAELGAELRAGTSAIPEKHLETLARLRAILTNPEGPEATHLFSTVSKSPKTKLLETQSEHGTEEIKLAAQQKELEEKPDVARPVTATIAFTPVEDSMLVVNFNGDTDTILLHEWSDWFDMTFQVSRFSKIYGVTRFYVQSISPELEVFMQPIGMDPRRPYVPISYPARFSRELAESDEVGFFKTQGWAAETDGLQDGKLDEKAFEQDLMETELGLEAITCYTYGNKEFSLFVSVFPGIDRVTRMMYHRIDPLRTFGILNADEDPIKQMYIQMDRVVGGMLDRIGQDENTVLFVISDRGFQPARYWVDLNAWLVEQGYMTLKELDSDALQQDTPNTPLFEKVDWSKTKAYSLGLGQIYINLKDREPKGIVDTSEYDALCDDIRTNLMGLTDNRSGYYSRQVVHTVGIGKDIWSGERRQVMGDMPDLQVGFEVGYGAIEQTGLTGINPNVIENNNERSGVYCTTSPDLVPGVILCNRSPLSVSDPSIVDLAPTVLRYFDLQVPDTMEGRNLLGSGEISERVSR